MKNQTKAILASVMILALALSSIGGVTYSWFSNSKNVQMDVSTASVNLDVEIYVKNENGKYIIDENGDFIEAQKGEDGKYIENENGNYNKHGDIPLKIDLTEGTEFKIVVINNSTIPVDFEAKVISYRYQAVNATLNESGNGYNLAHIGEVLPSGNGYTSNNNLWSSSYGSAVKYIKFNGQYLTQSIASIDQPDEGITIGGVNQRCDWVRHWEDYYTICESSIGTNQRSDCIDLTVATEGGFNGTAMPNLYIKIDCTQSRPEVINIVNGTAEADNIDELRPLYFKGQGFTIQIPREVLDGIQSVIVEVETSDSIKVSIRYFTYESNPTIYGNISIWYQDNRISGFLTAPASDRVYILYSTPEGG